MNKLNLNQIKNILLVGAFTMFFAPYSPFSQSVKNCSQAGLKERIILVPNKGIIVRQIKAGNENFLWAGFMSAFAESNWKTIVYAPKAATVIHSTKKLRKISVCKGYRKISCDKIKD